MKMILLLILICFFVSEFTNAGNPAQQVPFIPGESLRYVMHYSFVDGGEASLELTKTILDGKEVYHSKATAITISIVEKFYKVCDVYETYFNPANCLPFKAIRDIHEDSYKYYNEVYYDHLKDSVFSLKSGWHKVPPLCFDIISAFYFLRFQIAEQGKVNKTIKINTYFADEIFPLEMRYQGVETITTRMGKFECMKFVPVVQTGRVFDDEDDLTLWITNDKNMVPVRVQMDMIIGSLKLDLIEYKGLKSDFTAFKK